VIDVAFTLEEVGHTSLAGVSAVPLCAALDVFDVVPVVRDGVLVPVRARRPGRPRHAESRARTKPGSHRD
jgi:hypothetical protein